MLSAFIILVTLGVAGLLLMPKVANATLWRATVTPLASIIGSGFLLLGPILSASFGRYAVCAMALLCLLAYLFGFAIRFNIARLAQTSGLRSTVENRLDTLASWVLAFAYIISVAYYLNLLGAFSISLTSWDNPVYPRLITSGIFALVLVVGWTRGFHALERMEQVTVGVKLAIIAGLLFGMAWFFAQKAGMHALLSSPVSLQGWQAVALLAGLLVTVQGFETSRYLGAAYGAPVRIRSMRQAQWLSSGIYLVYIALLSFSIAPDSHALSETAIIDMTAIIAPVLPLLLIAAAISAQFSAAVADTGGAGGLVSELTGGRVSTRTGYAILVTAGLFLTWATSIFEIVSYASRAFALYYALQAMIAARGAWAGQADSTRHAGWAKTGLFAALALTGVAIALFGAAVE